MMLFKYASKHLQQTVSSAFVNEDWVKQVKERGAQNVIDVLDHDLNAQKTGMGKLRFYRNCIEHIIPDNVLNISIFLHIITTIVFIAF